MPKHKPTRSRTPTGSGFGVLVAIALVAATAGGFLYLSSRPPAAVPVANNQPASTTPAPTAPLPAPEAPGVPVAAANPGGPETDAPPIDMNNVVELLNLGNEMLERGDLDMAEQLYRRAVEVNPEDEDTHFNLGIALLRQKRTNDAIASYERALEIYPDYVEAQHNLANILLATGRTNEAIARLEEAVALNPDYAPVVNNLGRIRAMLREWDAALELLERAVELEPDHYDYQFNLGTARMGKGDFAGAVTAFEQALALKPGDLLTVNLYAQALAYNKQPDRAMDLLTDTLKGTPDNVELLFNLGQLQLHNGRPSAAQETFTRVTTLAPGFKAGHDALAQARLKVEQQVAPPLKSAE